MCNKGFFICLNNGNDVTILRYNILFYLPILHTSIIHYTRDFIFLFGKCHIKKVVS